MMVISLEELGVYGMQDQGKSEQISEYCDAAHVSCWNLKDSIEQYHSKNVLYHCLAPPG